MSERPRRPKPEITAPVQTQERPLSLNPFVIRTTPAQNPADTATWPLPNPRHEKFAQNVAAGMLKSEAYLDAGYSGRSAATGASLLMSDTRILGRIAALQKRAAEKATVTLASLIAELEEARTIARDDMQASAMVAATKEKAVLLGLRVEKSDVTTRVGDPKGLTDDELADIARGRGDGTSAPASDTEGPGKLVH